jgi:hypothetical protein
MKLDDAKLLIRSKGLEMYDMGNNNYSLQFRGEKLGSVSLIEGTSDEYRLEFDSIRLSELKRASG